jgi:kynureninase
MEKLRRTILAFSLKFKCEDKYEAEKLASLIAAQINNTTMIAGVAAVINNEIVIILKDKSSHSVLLKDNNTAIKLKYMIEEVVKEKKLVIESKLENYVVEVIVSEY